MYFHVPWGETQESSICWHKASDIPTGDTKKKETKNKMNRKTTLNLYVLSEQYRQTAHMPGNNREMTGIEYISVYM